MGKMILRPARLVQSWPSTRPIIEKQKHCIDANCISTHAGVVEMLDSLRLVYNEWISQFAVSERGGLHVGLYDLMDEVARVSCWTRFGRQSFIISQNVHYELLRSVTGDVRVDDLRFPYPCFFVGFDVAGPILGQSYVDGIFVQDSGNTVSITLCAAPSESEKAWKIAPAFSVDIKRGQGQTIREAFGQHISELYAQVAKLESAIGDGVSKAKVDGISVRAVAKTAARMQADEFSDHAEELSSATDFAAAVLCLLASHYEPLLSPPQWFPTSDLPMGKKFKKAAFQAGELEVRYLAFDTADAESRANGTSLGDHGPRAHWRKGHFRRQPFGPKGGSAYRPTWIRPVLVNAKNGPTAERSEYTVGARR